jgi:hypothetical protein
VVQLLKVDGRITAILGPKATGPRVGLGAVNTDERIRPWSLVNRREPFLL